MNQPNQPQPERRSLVPEPSIREQSSEQRTESATELDRDGEQASQLRPMIYVASLSDYNAGRLHGQWIDATQSPDELLKEIGSMLKTSPIRGAEEWAIHDYQDFPGLRLSEYESIETISRIALGIAEHGTAYALWTSQIGTDDLEFAGQFEDHYVGSWERPEDFANHILDQHGYWAAIDQIPEPTRHYLMLDKARFLRDLKAQYLIIENQGKTYAFEQP